MLIIGLKGLSPDAEERQWLRHPAVAGVILFARNIVDREQVTALVGELRECAARPLLITVDQEGGRVQRCREGFFRLPELARIGAQDAQSPATAENQAREHGWLMAAEMRAVGIDMSFAPVLDLARGNRAIGDRALHADPGPVCRLGLAYIQGMAEAGMAACVKHFPGHGSVLEDTHHETATDPRSWDQLRSNDLQPFAAAFTAGVESLMMAHVRYPAVAPEPAGCSSRWIAEILRIQMGFDGVVISDDIAMAAAGEEGDSAQSRVNVHLDAGCDLVLVCDPRQVPAALESRSEWTLPSAMQSLYGRPAPDYAVLSCSPRYLSACQSLKKWSVE